MSPVTRDSTKVLVGFADFFWAEVGTAEPAWTTELEEPDTEGDWTSGGFTEDGLEEELTKDIEGISVHEQLTEVDHVLTGVGLTLKFALAEDTIENEALAFGIGEVTTTAAAAGQIGVKTLTLGETLVKKAFCFMADDVGGYKKRVYIPKVASVGAVGIPYQRAGKRIYPVEFKALCAPSDIKRRRQFAPVTP